MYPTYFREVIIQDLEYTEMYRLISVALALAVPAFASTDYLVPYADGSDGWADAYGQAKGGSGGTSSG